MMRGIVVIWVSKVGVGDSIVCWGYGIFIYDWDMIYYGLMGLFV